MLLFINKTQYIDTFSLLLQRYVRKGIDAKNPAIPRFFFVTERTTGSKVASAFDVSSLFLWVVIAAICCHIRAVKPWPGTLCGVLGQDTLVSQCLSPPRCINEYRGR